MPYANSSLHSKPLANIIPTPTSAWIQRGRLRFYKGDGNLAVEGFNTFTVDGECGTQPDQEDPRKLPMPLM